MKPAKNTSEYVTKIDDKDVVRLTGWKAEALSYFLLLCVLIGFFVIVFETMWWLWLAWNYLT